MLFPRTNILRRSSNLTHISGRPIIRTTNGDSAMIKRHAFLLMLWLISTASFSFSQTANPDFTGVWGPYRGGRGADPKLAPPPATPIVLKGEYAKAYDARRAAEAEAYSRGEPLA